MTLASGSFPPGAKVEVDFRAGYEAPPDDLKLAAMTQAAWLFKESPHGQNLVGVASKNLPDGSISYHARDLLPAVKGAISPYTRRVAL